MGAFAGARGTVMISLENSGKSRTGAGVSVCSISGSRCSSLLMGLSNLRPLISLLCLHYVRTSVLLLWQYRCSRWPLLYLVVLNEYIRVHPSFLLRSSVCFLCVLALVDTSWCVLSTFGSIGSLCLWFLPKKSSSGDVPSARAMFLQAAIAIQVFVSCVASLN